jgi:hypothetical protein
MKRRTFIALLGGAASAWPLAAYAQQRSGNVARIGFLTRKTDASVASQIDAFRQGLQDLGWVEGKNIDTLRSVGLARGLPSRSSRAQPAFAQGASARQPSLASRFRAPVRLRFRSAQATPDTLRSVGLARGCATRSPSGRSVVGLPGLEPGTRPL